MHGTAQGGLAPQHSAMQHTITHVQDRLSKEHPLSNAPPDSLTDKDDACPEYICASADGATNAGTDAAPDTATDGQTVARALTGNH